MYLVEKDQRKLQKFAAFFLFCSILLAFSACRKEDSTENYEVFDFSGDTTKAAELVANANEDLNKIKIMYKKNEAQLEELKSAMSEKNIPKVREIAENLVYVINGGADLGQQALGKIEQAEAMNVSADFKDYLDLKSQSLQKQLEAFEHRRQAAILLRDSFGTNDPAAIAKAQGAFKGQEEIAQKMLAEAQEISKKANELAKESARRDAAN